MAIAVIETGGKQYTLTEGALLTIEKLPGVKVGDTVTFDKVLLIDDGKTTKFGTPFLNGVTITATLESEGKGKKIRVQKFKAKSRYSRALGHRQPYNKVTIGTIA